MPDEKDEHCNVDQTNSTPATRYALYRDRGSRLLDQWWTDRSRVDARLRERLQPAGGACGLELLHRVLAIERGYQIRFERVSTTPVAIHETALRCRACGSADCTKW